MSSMGVSQSISVNGSKLSRSEAATSLLALSATAAGVRPSGRCSPTVDGPAVPGRVGLGESVAVMTPTLTVTVHGVNMRFVTPRDPLAGGHLALGHAKTTPPRLERYRRSNRCGVCISPAGRPVRGGRTLV